MKKHTNLEQTPFIDLRSRDNTFSKILTSKLPYQNLPQNEDQMEFKTHKNFTQYDQKKYWLSNQKDQQIISQIIQAMRNEFRLGLDIETTKCFKQLIKKHFKVVSKYFDQDNPQIAVITHRAHALDARYNISFDKLLKIAESTLYPHLLVQLVPILHQNNELSLCNKYLNFALKSGLPEAFVWKGLISQKQGNGKMVYQMLKNAEMLKFQPVAYKYLGQLFMGKRDIFCLIDLPANYKLADKYFKKAKQYGAYIEPYIQVQIQQVQVQKKKEKQRFNLLKSNENTQAVQLSNFIANKMKEIQMSKNSIYQVGMRTINNMANSESTVIFNDPKTFYVVFSPLMTFQGRHFLAKDINGSLQYISIYNWDQISIQKLKLLHEVGTKVVLNQYIRKLGAQDQLPFYRVDNPHSVQFYKRTSKHTISDKQYRNFAKNLFQRNLLEKAMNIYKHMIMKGSEEMQIVYSNMGVIHEKNKNISQAIKCYQNSLEIKKFNKSQMRLSYIYIRNHEFNKAQKLINEIQLQSERQQMLKQIQKVKKEQNDNLNFSKTVKNKQKLIKQLYNGGNDSAFKMASNPTCSSNIRQDRYILLRFKYEFENALNVSTLPQEKFLDLLQSVFNSVDSKTLNKEIVQKFMKMTHVVYKLKFGNQLYPESAPYAAHVTPGLLQSMKSMYVKDPLNQTTMYMSMRQNYLQNRIQDLCLQLEQKGKYKQAEQIYRFTDNYCAPFNVKVAEMLFIQEKYSQCQQYSSKLIQFMNQFSLERFAKYIAELHAWNLKSLIRLKKYETVILKGQQFIKMLQSKLPQLLYENYSYKNGLTSFKSTKNNKLSFQVQTVKQLVSAQQLIRSINQQILRAFIFINQLPKAKQYLSKVLLKKNLSNYGELIKSYYQGRLLEILVIKMQDSTKAIKEISLLQKEINNDKKLQNKQSYIKFLLKQKLSLLIQAQKIQEAIKQSEEIVKITTVNLIFVKNKLFSLIKKSTSKAIEILNEINSSQILKCLWNQLYEKSKSFLQEFFNKEENQQTKILIALQKLDINQEPVQEQDQKFDEQETQSIHAKQFQDAYSQEKNDSFDDLIQNQEYKNQICRFKGKNGLIYIVIFDQSLQQSLQVAQYHKFVLAADHLCQREKGSTGIKIKGSQLRLKIRMPSRLIGRIVEDSADPKLYFCYFNKRQKHDDYKRHKNK